MLLMLVYTYRYLKNFDSFNQQSPPWSIILKQNKKNITCKTLFYDTIYSPRINKNKNYCIHSFSWLDHCILLCSFA